MQKRIFVCDNDPSLLVVGDVLDCCNGERWQVVSRLEGFPVFELKNRVSGELMLAQASEYKREDVLVETELRTPQELLSHKADNLRQNVAA